MYKIITDSLNDAIIGMLQFIFGFVTGMVFDVVFFRIHKKIDPTQKSVGKLFILIMIQLYILLFLISLTTRYSPHENRFLRLGIFSSQIFLLEFAINKLSVYIYDRNNETSMLKNSLKTLPVIGGIFDFL